MDANEIINWMAYELTCDSEYMQELNSKDVICTTKEQEADMIRKLWG